MTRFIGWKRCIGGKMKREGGSTARSGPSTNSSVLIWQRLSVQVLNGLCDKASRKRLSGRSEQIRKTYRSEATGCAIRPMGRNHTCRGFKGFRKKRQLCAVAVRLPNGTDRPHRNAGGIRKAVVCSSAGIPLAAPSYHAALGPGSSSRETTALLGRGRKLTTCGAWSIGSMTRCPSCFRRASASG
jgi:hypothetical protein